MNIIKDFKMNVFFGYLELFPFICAQGNTIDKIKTNINLYYETYKASNCR